MSEPSTLKITLVENYLPDAQQSMLKFGELMAEVLVQKGLDVDRISPRAIWGTSLLARFRPAYKWLGYVDKYLIFPLELARYAKKNPTRLFHIVDHSNAVYEKSLRGRALVITCHDLMAISSAKGEVPQNPTGWTGRILQAWILRHLKNIKHVVSDSNKTRSEVLRHCGSAAQQKVSVVHIGLNSVFKPIPPEQVLRFLQEFAPTRLPYFFHVGGNQWYKNRPGIVKLFSELIQHHRFKDHHLILAGKPWSEDLRTAVANSGCRERVHEVTELSFEHLNHYYCGAEALLFPSWLEGYGWPILEAQACGTWVIASNREPLMEVGGAGALYIDPEQAAEAAQNIATHYKLKQQHIELGYCNLKAFSHEAMLQGYLKAYREAHEDARPR